MILREPSDRELDEAVAHYREHGWARLGRLATDETLALLRARVDAIMLGEVVYDGLFFQHDAETGRYEDLTYGKGWVGPSLRYRKIEKLEKDPLFWAWMTQPTFRRIAHRVYPACFLDDGANGERGEGSANGETGESGVIGERGANGESSANRERGTGVTIYRAFLMNKHAGGGSNLPWHQDGGEFWGLDREPLLQIWTALDDAGADGGCVEVVDGSHAGGLVTKLGGVVPDNHLRAKDADARATPLPADAGDVILIHNHVWHRSGRSNTGRARRAFSACYMDGATTCTRKKRAPRQFVRVF